MIVEDRPVWTVSDVFAPYSRARSPWNVHERLHSHRSPRTIVNSLCFQLCSNPGNGAIYVIQARIEIAVTKFFDLTGPLVPVFEVKNVLGGTRCPGNQTSTGTRS